jgi:hypothetical protein
MKVRAAMAGLAGGRVAVATAVIVTLAIPSGARAQSPSPTYYMFDSHAGGSFPPNAPYTSGPPGAIVIEGLGSAAHCTGLHYSQSQIESSAVSWMNAAYNVVIEISPQSVCGTIAQYESEFSAITTYVEAHASNPGQYWGGFMLDEEPSWYSYSNYKTLNNYTISLMGTTPGMSWWFTENEPINWGGLANYNSLVNGSWPAPQAYNDNFVSTINAECSTYGVCENLATVWSTTSYPWDDYLQVLPKVNGTPWHTAYWAAAYYWFNEFRGA